MVVVIQLLSHAHLFETSWTVACQTPLSMGFSRQEYWRGLPFPSPWDLPNSGIEPRSHPLTGRLFTIEPPEKPICNHAFIHICDFFVCHLKVQLFPKFIKTRSNPMEIKLLCMYARVSLARKVMKFLFTILKFLTMKMVFCFVLF